MAESNKHNLPATPNVALAENVLAPAHAFMDLLQQHDAEGRLGDATYRAEVYAHATPEDALAVAKMFNTTLYGTETHLFERPIKLQSGEGSERVVGFIGLDPKDGPDVFSYGFQKSQDMVRREGASALGKAGEIVGGTIVGTQMFADGNKRTARAAYLAVAEGFDGSTEAQDRYERVLSHTMEARRSIFFFPHDASKSRSFMLEGKTEAEIKTFADFEMALQMNRPDRDALATALSQVTDESVREQCIDVLQQNTFGAAEITHILGDTPTITNRYDKDEVAGVMNSVRGALGTVTNEQAQGIIAQDHANKKAYLMRLVDSSTGESPLYCRDSGGRLSTIVATL